MVFANSGWEEFKIRLNMKNIQSFINKNYIRPVELEVPHEMKVGDFPELDEDIGNLFNNELEDY